MVTTIAEELGIEIFQPISRGRKRKEKTVKKCQICNEKMLNAHISSIKCRKCTRINPKIALWLLQKK